MITIRVKNPIKLPVEKSSLIKAAQVTLGFTDHGETLDLSIVVGNDSLLHELNQRYRRTNAPTDVLAFPAGEIDPDTSDLYLGDVIISLPQARRQAAADNHPLGDELQLLVVHGILHLLGYDHLKTADRKRMQTIQDTIIKTLALSLQVKL